MDECSFMNMPDTCSNLEYNKWKAITPVPFWNYIKI